MSSHSLQHFRRVSSCLSSLLGSHASYHKQPCTASTRLSHGVQRVAMSSDSDGGSAAKTKRVNEWDFVSVYYFRVSALNLFRLAELQRTECESTHRDAAYYLARVGKRSSDYGDECRFHARTRESKENTALPICLQLAINLFSTPHNTRQATKH